MPGMIDERIAKARKARRKRLVGRIALYVVSATIGLGVGTVLVNTTQADAVSQTAINKYIRAHGGIAPCKWEDGSGQAGPCVWLASVQGNGQGVSFVAMPDGADKDDDKEIVYLSGPKAKRY